MSSSAAVDVFPHIDASKQDCLTDKQCAFFRDNGLLIIRNVLKGQELADLREQTLAVVQMANADRSDRPDFHYKKHELTGERVPARIEYIIDKTSAGKSLLGHPFILRSAEKIHGRDFLSTYDSMVFKNAGAGAAVPWHRDGSRPLAGMSIVNIGLYLDESDLSNCLWGIPGSNLWSEEQAKATVDRLNKDGFHTDGAIPLPMNPGDAILHSTVALHGSPAAQSKLRRVFYIAFLPIEIERQVGPHTLEYIPLKQRQLLACLRDRAQSPYSKGEKPFVYNPSPEFAPPPFSPTDTLETYRYPHEKFWRDGRRNG